MPDEPPPIVVAASQENAAELAGRIGDGYMNVAPDKKTLQTYEKAGGGPKHGKVTGCWGTDRDKALQQAHEVWPNMGLGGSLSQELSCSGRSHRASRRFA